MTSDTIEKAQEGFDSKGLDTNTTNDLDFPTCDLKSKAILAIRTKLTLLDHGLTVMHCNDFLVHTFGKNHYCKDLETLSAFANKLEVNK